VEKLSALQRKSEDLTFKEIWKNYAQKNLLFDKKDFPCPFCKSRKSGIIKWYYHVTKIHTLERPAIKEFAQEILIRKFNSPTKPIPIEVKK